MEQHNMLDTKSVKLVFMTAITDVQPPEFLSKTFCLLTALSLLQSLTYVHHLTFGLVDWILIIDDRLDDQILFFIYIVYR